MDRYNDILWRTHDRRNVLILHLRAYYIDKARFWNYLRNLVAILPVVALVGMYVFYFLNPSGPLTLYDIQTVSIRFTGVASVVAGLMSFKVKEYKSQSDKYRELFDCNVFSIEPDAFMADFPDDSELTREALERKAYDLETGPVDKKHCVWYNEAFCDNHAVNVISSMSQNMFFTRDIYREMEKTYTYSAIAIGAATLVLSILFGILVDVSAIIPILFAVAPKEYLLISSMMRAKDLWNGQQHVIDEIRGNLDNYRDASDISLRNLQSHLFHSRVNDMFVPKYRYQNFKERMHDQDNESNVFRDELQGDLVRRVPMSADEIMVVGTNYDSDVDSDYVMLSTIQKRIRTMMSEIHDAFAAEGIDYYIIGGTLIEVMREDAPVYWDDDMDICVRYEDLDRAKAVIRERMSKDTAIQDESDPYFIPYGCKFRVRDSGSVTDESDNLMYPHFSPDKRGVFIDVYAMTHPLANSRLEASYRSRHKVLFEKMRELEDEILTDTPLHPSVETDPKRDRRLERNLKRYSDLKARFLELERKYMSEERDVTRLGFAPSYSCEKQKLPYYDVSQTFSDRTVPWNGLNLRMPADPEAILDGFYGKGWKAPSRGYITRLKHILTYDPKG